MNVFLLAKLVIWIYIPAFQMAFIQKHVCEETHTPLVDSIISQHLIYDKSVFESYKALFSKKKIFEI